MNKTFTCIVCPNGCDIEVGMTDTRIETIEGALCVRGREYVEQELHNPFRNIASSVLVDGGDCPLVSVRLSAPVPKARIFDVMDEIRGMRITAPVALGEVLIANVLGLGSDVIATRHVHRSPAV